MKKYLLLLFAFAFMLACNNDTKEKKEGTATEGKKDETADLSNNPVYQKGIELIANNDCMTCHNLKGEERIQGPAYWEVAERYKDRPDTIVDYLARKIIAGGSGNWPETAPYLMTPHPGLSEEDAKAMVKFIFLIKK
jgi:cytochrome c